VHKDRNADLGKLLAFLASLPAFLNGLASAGVQPDLAKQVLSDQKHSKSRDFRAVRSQCDSRHRNVLVQETRSYSVQISLLCLQTPLGSILGAVRRLLSRRFGSSATSRLTEDICRCTRLVREPTLTLRHVYWLLGTMLCHPACACIEYRS
jgi:hypothetical protein